MKTVKIFAAALIALGVASCSTGKESGSADSTETAFVSVPFTGDLNGEWLIDEINIYDTLSLKPAEISPDELQTVTFTDSTYHFQTNCNLVQGEYTQNGDTISFGMGLSTRMACPDMRIEDAINQLLPQLEGIGMDNDSTIRIVAKNPSAYILLRKVATMEE